jgi:hypothetical protein
VAPGEAAEIQRINANLLSTLKPGWGKQSGHFTTSQTHSAGYKITKPGLASPASTGD